MSALPVLPIDDTARDGRPVLVVGDVYFAIARWHDDSFFYDSGLPLEFEPRGYCQRGSHG